MVANPAAAFWDDLILSVDIGKLTVTSDEECLEDATESLEEATETLCQNAVVSQETNSNPPRFKCDECGSKYIRFGDLDNHLREKHGRVTDVTFTCDICMKVFDRIKKLNRHMKTHNSKKWK